MTSPTRRVLTIAFLALGGLLVAGLPASGQKKTAKHPNRETYRGFAMAVGAPAGGRTSTIDITVDAYTTDEDRQDLLEVVADAGRRSRKLPKALRKQDKVGWIRVGQSLSWDLRYAREWERDGHRSLILATDRPVSMGEAMTSARSRDYGVSIVQLELDAEGKGEGVIMVGTDVYIDEETGQLTLEHLGTQPVRFTNVKRTN